MMEAVPQWGFTPITPGCVKLAAEGDHEKLSNKPLETRTVEVSEHRPFPVQAEKLDLLQTLTP